MVPYLHLCRTFERISTTPSPPTRRVPAKALLRLLLGKSKRLAGFPQSLLNTRCEFPRTVWWTVSFVHLRGGVTYN